MANREGDGGVGGAECGQFSVEQQQEGRGGRSHRRIKRPPRRRDLVTLTEMGPHADEIKVLTCTSICLP